MLGDIALAYCTVQREAAAEGKPIADHVSHLVIHGTLHLLGEDHEDPAEAEAMEAMERRAMARLGLPDPYADTVLQAAGLAPGEAGVAPGAAGVAP